MVIGVLPVVLHGRAPNDGWCAAMVMPGCAPDGCRCAASGFAWMCTQRFVGVLPWHCLEVNPTIVGVLPVVSPGRAPNRVGVLPVVGLDVHPTVLVCCQWLLPGRAPNRCWCAASGAHSEVNPTVVGVLPMSLLGRAPNRCWCAAKESLCPAVAGGDGTDADGSISRVARTRMPHARRRFVRFVRTSASTSDLQLMIITQARRQRRLRSRGVASSSEGHRPV